MAAKLDGIIWFTAGADTVGIALTDNGFEKKAYIKKVSGLNEKADIVDVMQNGARFKKSQALEILNHLNKNDE